MAQPFVGGLARWHFIAPVPPRTCVHAPGHIAAFFAPLLCPYHHHLLVELNSHNQARLCYPSPNLLRPLQTFALLPLGSSRNSVSVVRQMRQLAFATRANWACRPFQQPGTQLILRGMQSYVSVGRSPLVARSLSRSFVPLRPCKFVPVVLPGNTCVAEGVSGCRHHPAV